MVPVSALEGLSLSKFFADTVTADDKQDIAFLLVGAKGMGKSYSALTYAYQTAVEISKNLKRGTWQDYFPIDQETGELLNVSTIATEDHLNLLKETKQHNVYLLDDIGVGWNARKYKQESNMLLNDIFELIRIDNTVIIMTVMDQFLIDKVPREIVPVFGEVVVKNHKSGYNIIKVFKNSKLYRIGKLIHPYIADQHSRVCRCVVDSPPKEIAKAYDKLRARKTKEHRLAKINQYLNGEPKENKPSPSDIRMQEYLTQYGKKIKKARMEGMSFNKIAEIVPLDPRTIRKIAANIVSSHA